MPLTKYSQGHSLYSISPWRFFTGQELQMLGKPLHDFGVSIFHTAHIAAETVLVQLFAGLGIPETAGVGADLVGQDDGPVRKTAELQLEIHQGNASFLPESFQLFVDGKGVLFDGLDLFGSGQLHSDGVIGVHERIVQRIALIGKLDGGGITIE